ncbi:hypothetical protein [Saccharothrix syringae]|uniref:Uncharacterized protein n=1 Tax=Saccharothrix syringae TaxID=103733 RepID=A0A5Q0GY56_SACSY|nr:hypothetical protein [Saccharothrix syringae]QFZ18615.1 hypothetical protein EKG83_15120 [Saccharothrix syringae]
MPRTPAQWRAFPSSYSADYRRVADEDDLEQVESGRLGFAGADENTLLALEERLGRRPATGRSCGCRTGGPTPARSRTRPTPLRRSGGWVADVNPALAEVFPEGETFEYLRTYAGRPVRPAEPTG